MSTPVKNTSAAATPAGSPILANMESKIDKLTSIVKAAQTNGGKPQSPKQDNKKKVDQKETPHKDKGFNTGNTGEGRKPLQCWKCGGWGHTSRGCPTPSNMNWRELHEAALAEAKDSSKQ